MPSFFEERPSRARTRKPPDEQTVYRINFTPSPPGFERIAKKCAELCRERKPAPASAGCRMGKGDGRRIFPLTRWRWRVNRQTPPGAKICPGVRSAPVAAGQLARSALATTSIATMVSSRASQRVSRRSPEACRKANSLATASGWPGPSSPAGRVAARPTFVGRSQFCTLWTMHTTTVGPKLSQCFRMVGCTSREDTGDGL